MNVLHKDIGRFTEHFPERRKHELSKNFNKNIFVEFNEILKNLYLYIVGDIKILNNPKSHDAINRSTFNSIVELVLESIRSKGDECLHKERIIPSFCSLKSIKLDRFDESSEKKVKSLKVFVKIDIHNPYSEDTTYAAEGVVEFEFEPLLNDSKMQFLVTKRIERESTN